MSNDKWEIARLKRLLEVERAKVASLEDIIRDSKLISVEWEAIARKAVEMGGASYE